MSTVRSKFMTGAKTIKSQIEEICAITANPSAEGMLKIMKLMEQKDARICAAAFVAERALVEGRVVEFDYLAGLVPLNEMN